MQPKKSLLVQSSMNSNLEDYMQWPVIVSRTVPLSDRRAKLRLESIIWNGLEEIAEQQRRPLRELCDEVNGNRPFGVALNSAIRSYVLDYFRRAERTPNNI
ncbi:ribbon-helix-helix domain-containing protein [Azospirillum lipoferum]